VPPGVVPASGSCVVVKTGLSPTMLHVSGYGVTTSCACAERERKSAKPVNAIAAAASTATCRRTLPRANGLPICCSSPGRYARPISSNRRPGRRSNRSVAVGSFSSSGLIDVIAQRQPPCLGSGSTHRRIPRSCGGDVRTPAGIAHTANARTRHEISPRRKQPDRIPLRPNSSNDNVPRHRHDGEQTTPHVHTLTPRSVRGSPTDPVAGAQRWRVSAGDAGLPGVP
jgi:hypothetical protein